MATSGEGNVEPTVKECSKETTKLPAEAEQQNDAGKGEATPKSTSETAARDAEKKKDGKGEPTRSKSRSKSLSPEPELGKTLVKMLAHMHVPTSVYW